MANKVSDIRQDGTRLFLYKLRISTCSLNLGLGPSSLQNKDDDVKLFKPHFLVNKLAYSGHQLGLQLKLKNIA